MTTDQTAAAGDASPGETETEAAIEAQLRAEIAAEEQAAARLRVEAEGRGATAPTPAPAGPHATTVRPSPGRVVLCFDPAADGGRPAPGIVIRVDDDTPVPAVTVKVFGPDADARWRAVPLYDAGHGAMSERRCEWMPYQVQQAAKAKL